jgi:catechol 2,3-dioxygenase-like lactoylglutathione lyase family enzyme
VRQVAARTTLAEWVALATFGIPAVRQREFMSVVEKERLMTLLPRFGRRFKRSATHRLAFLTLVAVFIPNASHALDQPEAKTPPFNGIAHIAVRVHDLAAARDFYEKLGFEQAFDLSKNGVSYESFIKINDTQFIELYPTTDHDPKAGFLHLCFEGADLNAIHDDYVSRGLTPKIVRKAGAGNLLFTMAGPMQPDFPQNIEYTQYMPGSLHSNDEGKHLGPDRIADKLVSVSLAMQDPAAARDFYINQLNFKPIAGDPMALHLPGDSGEEVRIAPASLGGTAHITLRTENLGKAARRLHKEQIPTKKDGDTLTIVDPDGDVIVLESR